MSNQPQVYPDTKIITLLESNSEQGINNVNGSFNINLDQQVILKEGDTLELNKVFIDTTPSEETFINISPEETEITIKHGIYLTDMLPNDITPGNPAGQPDVTTKPLWGNWSASLANRPDGKKYILQNEEPAFNDTFLDWEAVNNPEYDQTTPQFKTELTAILPESNNGFEYVVTALLPSPAPTPAYPVSAGEPLSTAFYMGGHCRLIATGSVSPLIGPYEFYYYNRDYTPPAGGFGPNDHTAVIQRWTGPALVPPYGNGVPPILGWKIKGNPDTTELDVTKQWLFKSDTAGYNYFDCGKLDHMIQITEVAMVINQNFIPTLNGGSVPDPNFPIFPGYIVNWYDPRTQQTHSFQKIFNNAKYKPVISGPNIKPPQVIGGGMIELLSVLPTDSLIKYDDRVDATAKPPLNLPKDKNLGWGRGNGFEFYKLKQFPDPYDASSLVTLPKMTISVNHMPEINYYFYSKGTTKTGLDSGFINTTATGWYNPIFQSMTMNSAQILAQTPVTNAGTGGRTMLPREYTTTFSIAPGNYSNGDLAQLLTDNINANTSPVVGLSNNPGAEKPVVNAAGYSSSYFLQTTYELMEQADSYSQLLGLPANLTRYPNDYAYSAVVIPERTLSDGTILAEIPASPQTSLGVQPYFLSEDASELFQFKADAVQPLGSIANVKARNVGASEVSILFDETEQAFTIAQAHTNIIGGDSKTPIEPMIQLIRGLPENDKSYFGNQIACDTYSGVFFTALEPQSLWFGKMGLSHNLLTTTGGNFSAIKDFSTDIGSSFNSLTTAPDLSSVLCHQTSLTKGVNITGLFNGVDNIIVKAPYPSPAPDPTQALASNFAVQPQLFSELVNTSTLVSIVGASQVNATEDDPYFQVEIAGINTQNIVGQPVKNSLVQGIVGKFYSNGNFTQDESAGYSYTHKGEPLIIRQLGVRILDSTGKPEEGLGPRSAVILKISTDK